MAAAVFVPVSPLGNPDDRTVRMVHEADDLGSARGIVMATLMGLSLWAPIIMYFTI
jgi:hypothetical protein